MLSDGIYFYARHSPSLFYREAPDPSSDSIIVTAMDQAIVYNEIVRCLRVSKRSFTLLFMLISSYSFPVRVSMCRLDTIYML